MRQNCNANVVLRNFNPDLKNTDPRDFSYMLRNKCLDIHLNVAQF